MNEMDASNSYSCKKYKHHTKHEILMHLLRLNAHYKKVIYILHSMFMHAYPNTSLQYVMHPLKTQFRDNAEKREMARVRTNRGGVKRYSKGRGERARVGEECECWKRY